MPNVPLGANRAATVGTTTIDQARAGEMSSAYLLYVHGHLNVSAAQTPSGARPIKAQSGGNQVASVMGLKSPRPVDRIVPFSLAIEKLRTRPAAHAPGERSTVKHVNKLDVPRQRR